MPWVNVSILVLVDVALRLGIIYMPDHHVF